jgi:enoyl-CoA hydratase/carnithine racemase
MSDILPDPDLVLYEELTPHIALVTLNRPDKRNAVNPALAAALETIVRRTEADRQIRAVILTSSQDRVFCAGADLAAITSGNGKGIETAAGGFAGITYAARIKPWIAVVEGMALGGGCEIAFACDMIVASDNARFGLPEVKRGLLAGAGGVHRIGALLPRNLANELIATGDPLDGERAYHFGLVNRLTPPGGALAAARELADAIVVNAPIAVQYSLMAARLSAAQPDGFGRAVVAERFAALRNTEDFKEGPRAFVEKREPVWTGR